MAPRTQGRRAKKTGLLDVKKENLGNGKEQNDNT
jgi:hypothetical protein